MPGTKPPPSTRAFFQVYVSAATAVVAASGVLAATAGGVPASSPAARASTAVRMRALRTVGSSPGAKGGRNGGRERGQVEVVGGAGEVGERGEYGEVRGSVGE